MTDDHFPALRTTSDTPLIAIVSTTLICISVSIFSLMSGWLTIFQNLFYIPIIIACIYYARRGFVFSVALSCGYFFLMALFSRDPGILEGALIRVLIFILVAAVITYLSVIQQRTEAALRNSEELYRTLVEKANEAIIIAQDGVFAFANVRMSGLLGVPVEELEGRPFADFIHPDDRRMVTNSYRRRLDGEKIPESYDFRILGARGRIVWVSITAARILWKDRPATLNLLTDITGRKQMEEALRNSEEFNRGLVENIPDIVVVYGSDRKIRFINPAVNRILGYLPDSVVGTDILSYISEDQRTFAEQAIADRVQSGFSQPVEIDLIAKEGHRLTMITKGTITNFRSEQAILLMLTDISERKRYEQEMKDHTDETERYSSALAIANKKLNLLGSLTRHDILNKLAVISAYTLQLKKRLDDPEILGILKEQESIVRMIGEYLMFTKMYEKIGVTAPVWVDLDAVIQRAFAATPHKKITLEADRSGVSVWADPLLEKVFANLLENAVRHGGHVTQIRVSAQMSEAGLTIFWEDDGMGIPVEEKEDIFARGYGQNTGLGLFLVREILGITGITITETGEPGAGARFEIVVPKGGYRMCAMGNSKPITGSRGDAPW